MVTRQIAVGVVAVFFFPLIGDRTAATGLCGTTIAADFTLHEDLTCAGDGLIAGADDITLNLNGYTLSGSGAGNGVTVRNRTGVIVKGGTIRGFVSGIMVGGSTDILIKGNYFTANREAVFLNGSSMNTVKDNVALLNQLRGIMIRPSTSGVPSRNNVVNDNTLTGNPSGILVFGQADNTLKDNRITGSSVAAIDLTGPAASGNVVKDNTLALSAAGIKFGAGWFDNDAFDNQIESNTCGLQGPAAANTLHDNVLTGNGSDFCA